MAAIRLTYVICTHIMYTYIRSVLMLLIVGVFFSHVRNGIFLRVFERCTYSYIVCAICSLHVHILTYALLCHRIFALTTHKIHIHFGFEGEREIEREKY